MGYITLAELGASSVPTPSSGKDQLYFDSSDGLLKRKSSAGTVTIVSSNEGVYRTVSQANAFVAALSGLSANTFFFTHAGILAVQGASAANGAQGLFYSRTADYSSTSFTTKYRLSAQLHTNATAPTVSYTFGLHAVTGIAGAAGQLTYTIGAATSGSTVVFTTQGASTQGQGNSGDFTIPADGYYAICVVPTGAGAANSAAGFTAQLQMRNV